MTRYGEAALGDEADRLAFGASQGSRHQELFRSAFRMGQLVGGGELDLDRATSVLIRVGTAIGLAAGDVFRHVDRGLQRGQDASRRPSQDGQMIRDRTDALLQAVDLWEHAATTFWPGRAGRTRLRLFAAFVIAIMRIGKVQISLSVRQWAEEAGVSKSTASKHAPHLTPWIIRRSRGNRGTGESSTWRLGVPPKRANSDIRAKPDGLASGLSEKTRLCGAGSIHDPSADHFNRKDAAWQIANILDPEGPDMTVKALVEATGQHQSTVRRNLKFLASVGMVERIDWLHWRALPDVDEVLLLAFTQYGAKRRKRHRQEREVYRRSLVDPETGEIREPKSQRDQGGGRSDGAGGE